MIALRAEGTGSIQFGYMKLGSRNGIGVGFFTGPKCVLRKNNRTLNRVWPVQAGAIRWWWHVPQYGS